MLITSSMLDPIVDAITTNLEVLLPVGIGVMATFIGVSLIPRVVYKFL